jgi:Flp pilus assembly protein TadG
MTPPHDHGSAPVEFVLVGMLLVVLVLSVLQVGAVLFVRNTALDAAAEGARWAALAGNTGSDGAARARQVLTVSLGPAYARDVRAGITRWQGGPATVVTVRAPLPVLGLIGPAGALEATGHAALEPVP